MGSGNGSAARPIVSPSHSNAISGVPPPGEYVHPSAWSPGVTGASLVTAAGSPARLSANTSRPSYTYNAKPPVQSPIAHSTPAPPPSGTLTSAVIVTPPNMRGTESSGTGPPSGRYTLRAPGGFG